MPERLADLSGGPFGSKALPWDIPSIQSVGPLRPAAGDLAREIACAKDVTASFSLGGGTSVTAKTRNVWSWYAAGKLRNASRNDAAAQKLARHMRKRNEHAERDDVRKTLSRIYLLGKVVRLRPLRRAAARARGHAAENLLVLFVTGLAVMTPFVPPATAARATAAKRVARRCVEFSIASGSGCAATPRRDDSSAGSSMTLDVAIGWERVPPAIAANNKAFGPHQPPGRQL